MSLRCASRGGLVLVSLAFLSACSGVADPEADPIGQADQAILGGYDDTTDTAVVGVAINFGDGSGAICSGSLIAPNVVLTAHHCVAPVLDEENGGVDCVKTNFGTTYPPRFLSITTGDMIDVTLTGSHDVQEIVVPPGGDTLCGFDQAILILSDSVNSADATPIVPRVDTPLVKGEVYSAIGYGGTDDNGDGAGQRRRRDKLHVMCIAGTCPAEEVKATEFIGDTGICHGDSGGPAIDALGRVVGVTSRGGSGCTNPVYGYVGGWAQWIMDTTANGSLIAGTPPPPWADGWPTDPQYSMPIGAECKKATDCPSSRCLGDYCTRLCNDASPCPDGYTCSTDHSTDPVCTEVPPAPAASATKPKQASTPASSGCAVGAPSSDPTKPTPWFAGASLIAALALLRRRKQR